MAKLYCSACGTPNSETANFCSCGNGLRHNSHELAAKIRANIATPAPAKRPSPQPAFEAEYEEQEEEETEITEFKVEAEDLFIPKRTGQTLKSLQGSPQIGAVRDIDTCKLSTEQALAEFQREAKSIR